jgi:hypothetical protein
MTRVLVAVPLPLPLSCWPIPELDDMDERCRLVGVVGQAGGTDEESRGTETNSTLLAPVAEPRSMPEWEKKSERG